MIFEMTVKSVTPPTGETADDRTKITFKGPKPDVDGLGLRQAYAVEQVGGEQIVLYSKDQTAFEVGQKFTITLEPNGNEEPQS